MAKNGVTSEPTLELASSIHEQLQVRVYGKKITDLALSGSARIPGLSDTEHPLNFVMVYGLKVMGKCKTLPEPILILLPSDGKQPTRSDCGEFLDPNQFRVWTLPQKNPIAIFSYEITTLENAFPEVKWGPPVDVDFDGTELHFHNVALYPSYITGYFRAKVVIHVHRGGFAHFDKTFTPVNEDIPFTVRLENPSVTLVTIGCLSARATYDLNSGQLCGSVDVNIDLEIAGHVSKSFRIACVKPDMNHIPHPQPHPQEERI